MPRPSASETVSDVLAKAAQATTLEKFYEFMTEIYNVKKDPVIVEKAIDLSILKECVAELELGLELLNQIASWATVVDWSEERLLECSNRVILACMFMGAIEWVITF